jgi:hypothetical protein
MGFFISESREGQDSLVTRVVDPIFELIDYFAGRKFAFEHNNRVVLIKECPKFTQNKSHDQHSPEKAPFCFFTCIFACFYRDRGYLRRLFAHCSTRWQNHANEHRYPQQQPVQYFSDTRDYPSSFQRNSSAPDSLGTFYQTTLAVA